MVTVRTSLPEEASASATLRADLEVQFAGQTAKYKQIPFEQTCAHSDHREFPAARHLKHVKIAVAVPRIERFDGHRYQEIALSGVANALASRRMADSVGLMEGVRHVICESRL